MASNTLFTLCQETLLHIFSYLDLPDLTAVAEACPSLAGLTTDPILHAQRLTVVAPARLRHFLFATDTQGVLLRPTVGDLVHRGVIRGLNIEQRWRMGQYIYTVTSIKQYEYGRRLARSQARVAISRQLDRRSREAPQQDLRKLHRSHVLPDIESSSPNVSRNLLPVMHKLKWSLRRAGVAKVLKDRILHISNKGIGDWLQGIGRCALSENERVRMAVCPDISKIIRFYEDLSVI